MQFHKKETPVQVLSSEFWEIFKNTFLTEHLQTTASELNLYQEVIKIVQTNISSNLSNSRKFSDIFKDTAIFQDTATKHFEKVLKNS